MAIIPLISSIRAEDDGYFHPDPDARLNLAWDNNCPTAGTRLSPRWWKLDGARVVNTAVRAGNVIKGPDNQDGLHTGTLTIPHRSVDRWDITVDISWADRVPGVSNQVVYYDKAYTKIVRPDPSFTQIALTDLG